MPAERYFYEGKLEGTVVLEGPESRHLSTVMRGKVGDSVELVDGKGGLAQARIQGIHKKSGTTLIIETVERREPPTRRLVLAQAIARPNRLDNIIEKGTELGVTDFWLFPGARSERNKVNVERVDKLMVAAMKQSGRLWLPRVEVKDEISKWGKIEMAGYFGDLDPQAPRLWDLLDGDDVVLVVGPEAGFTEKEVDALKGLGVVGVKLHDNILRTDTAAIAAVALATHRRLGLA